MEILNVMEQPLVDNSIASWEYHNYQPFINSKFEYNDELRIPIQELDAYTLPCESMLYLEGKITQYDDKPATKLKLINNAFAFLFREIRYEMNGILIDSVRNVGLTSTLKNYLSYNEDESIGLENAGWYPRSTRVLDIVNNRFSACIPLKMLMSFFEDYKKIILNMKQELVLIRCSNDIDAVIAKDESEKPKVHIERTYWRMPLIAVAIPQQLIGCDANAHHTFWGSKVVNQRGHGLDILNGGTKPTFVIRNRQEVIDITISNSWSSHLVTNWRVSSEVSMSDHRHILFNLETGTVPEEREYRNPKLTVWSTYKDILSRNVGPPVRPHTIPQIESSVKNLTKAVVHAYEQSCPVRKVRSRHSVPWWNPELLTLRKKARALFNRAMRTRTNADWDLYKEAQRQFKSCIKRSKRDAWKEFC
ncbi:hypothetical protein NQ315_000643 [Exocentrus adspersus]|uniref:Endonuclease/exonuclease/phosphatase domain-containing protein n=1 Tax=Exocentrus adspersus TaxID=1586481 RepID=A0AAV8VN84_9CUCU|nr:hypothetical protein NQ315_000643 [Exocentrus adspersus]